MKRTVDESGRHYEFVDVQINRAARTATFTIKAPEQLTENSIDSAIAAGSQWWPLQMARELDDAILGTRTNELEIGLWIMNVTGKAENVLAIDECLLKHHDNWFVREVVGMMRRTFARLDVSARSIYAFIERGSCFAGSLAGIGASRGQNLYARFSGINRAADHHSFRNEFSSAADGQPALALSFAFLQ